MRFKLIKTGKSFVTEKDEQSPVNSPYIHEELDSMPGVILWESGNVGQINSLLVVKEAELILARSQLTGNDSSDWYINNRILDLEIKIKDLREWLDEANEKHKQ